MPWWVPVVFVDCLWVGFHCSKERSTHLSVFFIFPTVFIGLAVSSLIRSTPDCMVGYAVGLGLGVLFGDFSANRTSLKISKFNRSVIVPGSWQLMILLMTLFATKFTFGFFRQFAPAATQTLQSIEWIVQGGVSGLLLGKAMNFARRYRLSK